MARRNGGPWHRTRRLELRLVACSMCLMLPMFAYVTWKMAGELAPGRALEVFSRKGAELENTVEPGSERLSAIDSVTESQVPAATVQLDQELQTKEPQVIAALSPDWSRTEACTFAKGVPRQETITTRALYHEIEFKNIDGGAWRQGWDVQYSGNEWDEHKLRVFVVPHSHNDPGWIRTVEEYYNEKTRNILDTILTALKQDSRRKFIWEEMSYLSLWWEEASQSKRDDFKWLVQQGQLEIVGGGWVMNDEANSHYFAIIDQMIEGHTWIQDHLGPEIVPKNAWQIDPFGHSPTMAYLNTRAGYQNMLIQRVHYEVKKKLAWNKDLEFLWRQAWDPKDSTDILCHMMPFYSYDVPHTCGPDPAICCQFDFIRLPDSGSGITCPWLIPPQHITEHNVAERASMILDQWRKKSTLFKTNAVIAPLGDDFRYTSVREAELQYSNYEVLFDYINKHPELNAEVQWGTLEDYFQAVREGIQKQETSKLPVLSGDFFTYSDRVEDYWSGYYVSRPFFKAVDRVLEETLRRAEILYTFAHTKCPDSRKLAENQHPKLVQARRSLAVFQHHDGVTGTAKDHVVIDYGQKLHKAITDLHGLMAGAIAVLLSKEGACQAEAQHFQFYHTRRAHDALPDKLPVSIPATQLQRIVLSNSLTEELHQVVSISVDSPNVCVLDSSLKPLRSQLNPAWESSTPFTLLWRATLPPLGLTTYFIRSAEEGVCQAAELAMVEVFNHDTDFQCPPPFICTQPSTTEVTITNQRLTLTFDTVTGLLKDAKQAATGQTTVVDEELVYYDDEKGGAYLFLPVGEAHPLTVEGGAVFVTRGPFLQEIRSVYNSKVGTAGSVSRTARLFVGGTIQGSLAEMQYHVAIGEPQYNNREVVVRYRTDVESGAVFHSDLNGFQMARRETLEKIPLQGNYYPMPALAFLQDDEQRFSVHSRQALGVASLKPGWLEMMLDRRLVQDDNRGLGQGVTDNHPNEIVFHLLFEQQKAPDLKLPQPWFPSLLSHRVTAQLAHPVHAFLASDPEDSHNSKAYETSFSPLAGPWPSDVFLVNLKTVRATRLHNASEPGVMLLLHRLAFDCSLGDGAPLGTPTPTFANPLKTTDFGGKNAFAEGSEQGPAAILEGLDVQSAFADMAVKNLVRTSLTGLRNNRDEMESDSLLHSRQLLARSIGVSGKRKVDRGHLGIEPMEIQAFKFGLEVRTR